ncbi:MAG: hypothetical protein RL450_859, partial [Actinomycetota bacterium]
MNLKGTNNEEQTELSKEESRYIRARSRKLLFSMLSPMKRRLGLAAILVLFSTAMRVAGPALIALGIDWALPQAIEGRTGSLWLVVSGYLSAALLSAVLVYYFLMITAKVSQKMLFELRNRMFVHTQKLSVEFHERYTAGRVIARQTSDLESIKELLAGGMGQLVVGLLFMLFTAIALLLLDPISFLVLLVSLLP